MLLLGIASIKNMDNAFARQYRLFKEGDIYHIEAIVASDATEKEYKDTYQIIVKHIDGKKIEGSQKWILNVQNSKKYTRLEYGDFIEFEGSVEIPSTARNYMGFDYQRYLKSNKIYGNITTKARVSVLKKNQMHGLLSVFYNIAKNIKEKIYVLLPENAKEVCVGILIGDKTDIKEDISNAFKNSNLTHMLAVSGAHVTYVMLGVSLLFSKSGKVFGKVSIILFLFVFMGVTKFTPSVVRAGLMAMFVLMANLFYKKPDVYTNISLSALILLIHNPYTILNIGFQLSYGGTIGIVILNKPISSWLYGKLGLRKTASLEKAKYDNSSILKTKLLKVIIDMIVISLSANLVIIPIMAFQFNTISLTFWISNLLAGHLLGVITIGGFALYFVSIFSMSLAAIMALPFSYVIQLLIFIADFCSKIPFSSITIRTPYILEIALYYVAICVILYFKKLKDCIKPTINITLVIVIVVIASACFKKDMRIYFVDVGQGDSTLIVTPSNTRILIDGGGSEMGSFDVGKQTLVPYLLDRKITKIDYMLISHFDSDHVRWVANSAGKAKGKQSYNLQTGKE